MKIFQAAKKKVALSVMSTKKVNFVSIPFGLNPMIHELLLILRAKISIHNKNKYGDNGHP